MNDYVIISDSTTDLTPEMIKEFEVEILPLSFVIDNKTYFNYPDERDLPLKEFYNLLRKGKLVTTGQINVNDFLEGFEKYLNKGLDILYVAFSSGLSGTYSSAKIAADEIRSKYPNQKIIVVDSLCASMGEALLLYYATIKKKHGESISEVANWLEQNKLNLCHWITVDDLFHLKRGGRVSATSAVMGTALGIKPVIHVDNEGRLIPVNKIRGRKQSLDALVDCIEKTALNPTDQVIYISHGDCREDAEYVGNQIRDKLKVKDVKINTIGPVIGAHAGPGTVALFFLGTER